MNILSEMGDVKWNEKRRGVVGPGGGGGPKRGARRWWIIPIRIARGRHARGHPSSRNSGNSGGSPEYKQG